MTSLETLDHRFRDAVSAIDAGDVVALDRLLTNYPELLSERLDVPGAWLRDTVGGAIDGFFRQPYLLWFVAEDPVRNGTLPANIAEITRTLIERAKRDGVTSLQEQLDYALRLVAWSWIARESGVQVALIDVLIDAGAVPGETPTDALINDNVAAAQRLVERGGAMTLAVALCLERWDDVSRLAETASARDKQVALVLNSLRGKATALARLIPMGVDLNAYSTDIYSHATALHHAVCSGSLDAVKLLVEAGADLRTKDLANHATPLGWAAYYQDESTNDDRTKRYAEIAAYLTTAATHQSRAPGP